MKNIVKAVLPVVVFLLSASSLFAQREPQTVQDVYVDKGGLVYSKQRQGPNADGEYTIYLKTFVTGNVSSQEQHIPSEFILVLDMSGSMNYVMGYDRNPRNGEKSRLQVLKEAVQTFVTMVKDDAIKNGVVNKIAIVKFAMNTYPEGETWESLEEGDDDYYYSYSYPHVNYTQLVKDFVPVNSDAGESTIMTAVNGLHASGATAADYGMHKAVKLINTLLASSTPSNKTVILFTDGEPTYSDEFNDSVANSTITYAGEIKSNTAYTNPVTGEAVHCKVYTIGTFTSKPDATSKMGRYMQRVSSNYPNATSIANTAEGRGTDYNDDGGYYFVASSASELEAAFAAIQKEQSSASIDLGESATCVDVVSQSFDIPYILDPNTGEPVTDVKAWTTPLLNITNDNKYIFATTGWQPAAVELTVDPVNAGSVSVTGFDYSKNACAIVNGQPQGKQLILEIPIKMDESAVGGQNVETNGPGSGIRYKEKVIIDGQEVEVDRIIEFDSPTISLPVNLEIEKVGLNIGESAKFRIQRKKATDTNWADYTTVFVTKKKDNTGFSKNSTVKIVGLDPDYIYRIIEDEGWSWSYGGTTVTGKKYDPVTGEESQVTDMSNGTAASGYSDNTVISNRVNLNPITFTNKKKNAQVRYAESIVINNFKNTSSEEATAGETVNSKEQPK